MLPFVDRGRVGWMALGGIGGGLAGTYVVAYLVKRLDTAGLVVPVGLVGVVILLAVWLWVRGVPNRRVYQIGVWCAAITLFATALGLVNVYSEWFLGGSVRSSTIMVANSATVGAALGVLIGIVDTDRTRQYDRVRTQRERIETLNERLTVLNRVLRHDIRNDVNLIEGYARMAANDRHPTDDSLAMIKEKAREIEAVSHRAREIEKLINADVADETIDLAALVREEVAELQGGYPDAMDITLELPDEAVVSGNALLGSAIDNLLENAVEHTDSSPVELDVSMTQTGDGVALTVADNGPGVPEREQDLLEQGEESALQHSDGMGLWLVNWSGDEFDGTLDIETRPDEGTAVRLWIPAPKTGGPEPTATDWRVPTPDRPTQ
jgi:signal transduction histidine kinase